MNISGIFSGNFPDSNSQSISNRMQQFRTDFQQLGQDLQAGDMAAAFKDFAALQKDLPSTKSASSQSSNPIAQDFQKLSKDLQSGNLSGAQQDLTTLQQDLQNQASQTQHHHHHHHSDGGSEANAISQVLSQLGQDLQSGNLAAAQQAYTSLQQDLQQFAIGHGALDSISSVSPASNTVNATA